MSTLRDALRDVQAAVSLKGDGAVQALDRAITAVLSYEDATCISGLLDSLKDDYEFPEGMYSVIHTVEAFGIEAYIPALLSALPAIRDHAPKWTSVALMRVLNSAIGRDSLVRHLHASTSEVKRAARWLCEEIDKRSPEFRDRTAPVSMAATT